MAELILRYLHLGFTHVLPLGYDHILFMLSIFFLTSRLQSVIVQCSVFTLAHSIALAVTALGYVSPPASVIEPLIAFSILVTAVENILHSRVCAWRLVIIFLFGLVHGMGFAGALLDIGLPEAHFFTALMSFNVGVEIAQLTVILAVYYGLTTWCADKEWYRERIVYPLSSAIGCCAMYLLFQRIVLS
ncbi:MAG: HupE/UreJ family protein [Candidatus Kapaibacterium sp.]